MLFFLSVLQLFSFYSVLLLFLSPNFWQFKLSIQIITKIFKVALNIWKSLELIQTVFFPSQKKSELNHQSAVS